MSKKATTILITGANGFIGRFLVQEAVSRGYSVVCTVRQGSDATSLENTGAHIERVEYTHEEKLADILSRHNVSFVIHNAGLTKAATLDAYMEANAVLPQLVVKACRQSGIQLKKFVLVSSLAAYGPADRQPDGIVRANSTPHPVTQYGKSKLAGERWLQDQPDIPWVIVRPTVVYGPGEKDLYSVFKLIRNHLDLKPGMVAPRLTFIYVRDLARFLVDAALHAQHRSAFFATDGNVYNGDALNGFIKETLGTWTISLRVPVPLLATAARISEWWGQKKGTYPILNRDKMNEIRAKSWVCDVSNHFELGFKAEYNLSRGVRETIAWYKENKWL